jgi:hypothetical protein
MEKKVLFGKNTFSYPYSGPFPSLVAEAVNKKMKELWRELAKVIFILY